MATIDDIGVAGQPLSSPPLTAWQAAVRDKLNAIPVGGICYSGTATIPDAQATILGLRDLASIGLGVTFPYPTTSIASVSVWGGYSSGSSTYQIDVFAYGTNAPVKGTPSLPTVAAQWASTSLSVGWANIANAQVGYKSRLNVQTINGMFHTDGTQTLLVYRLS